MFKLVQLCPLSLFLQKKKDIQAFGTTEESSNDFQSNSTISLLFKDFVHRASKSAFLWLHTEYKREKKKRESLFAASSVDVVLI